MSTIVAGLDFGTSNSAIGTAGAGDLRLHEFVPGSPSVPTALFYDEEDRLLVCGHEAETRFLEGHQGRYLRALKSILGTSLAEETTRLGRRAWPLRSLLVRFVAELKREVERAAGQEVTHLVAGRPVRFVDEDAARDRAAEALLREVLEEAGFKEVVFVYEPVAALIDAEESLDGAGYVLVADIGGGTSDFSLARRRAGGSNRATGAFEVLANHGVHIGGTDLDRRLSLKTVMAHFGYGSELRALDSGQILPVPPRYFIDLATWQKIHFCYSQATKREVRDVLHRALEPEKIARLLELLERQLGHRLANAVEQVKIALSGRETAALAFHGIDGLPAIEVDRAALSRSFAAPLARVGEAARRTLEIAGVAPAEVGHVVLTGGSTLLPDLRRVLLEAVPGARVVPSDPFAAVAKGLTKAAQRTFLPVRS